MKFNKTILGTTFALSALFATAGFNTEDAKAAEWTARSVEEVSADMQAIDESTSEYTVVYGDTLSVIANAAGVDVNTLVQINEIENADLIFPSKSISFTKNDEGEVNEVVVEDTNNKKDTYKVEEETVEKTETVEEAEETTVEPVAYEAEEETATVQATSYEAEETTEETSSTSSYSAAEEIPYQVLQVVETEAGPSYSEKAAVFSVILNRANSGNWGGTSFSAVVNASGQFEVVSNGMAASATVSEQTYQAVNDVLTNGVTTSAESFRASGDGVTNTFF
ncbi:LysM peptidoglycan-binding domain-containing protein [Carnobacterium sp. PL24RED07]|uniref:cell wall hydrolase n=1 Tax=unclassified Carnobacterium TaxID=257487 RepID=UPI0011EE9B99|nr:MULTISPECIES: cell wall hydrolase [unclassified Carnobacterium]KAF3303349.1 LysM peptidoglycan-binding domain-containing protein [Carnobacterium sp. PL26RED25]KAF3306633.1 LysM peptidoglycan-binding domain-containing protein [Carnobacterium sp. PL24RED07]